MAGQNELSVRGCTPYWIEDWVGCPRHVSLLSYAQTVQPASLRFAFGIPPQISVSKNHGAYGETKVSARGLLESFGTLLPHIELVLAGGVSVQHWKFG